MVKRSKSMERVLPITEYLIDISSDNDDKSSGTTPTDDQIFLLYFIMGTYFGPDLKDKPQKSVFQRRAENLPPYSPETLAGSCMKTVEIERIYYYILRKADQSFILKLPFLQQFLHGNLSTSTKTQGPLSPQFDDLFPPNLHPHSILKGQYETINNMVFISDPKIKYIGPEYIERFKRITKLEDVCLDKDEARFHTSFDGKVLYNIDVVQEAKYHKGLKPVSCSDTPLVHTVSDRVTDNGAQSPCGSGHCVLTGVNMGALAELGLDMIFMSSKPGREEWVNILNATKY